MNVAALVAVLFLFPVETAAAQYTGPGGLTLSAAVVSPGSVLTTSGSGFRPSSPVRLNFSSVPVLLATLQTTATGGFIADVTIPRDAAPGAHMIAATGQAPDGSVREITATVTVGDGAAVRATGTGSTVHDFLAWGVVLAGVVCVVVVTAVTRRRRAAAQEEAT